MPIDFCECSDPGCPCCQGSCPVAADATVFRVDMEDITGTRMCEPCAADALESGVFRATFDK